MLNVYITFGIPTLIVIMILFVHWVADFLCQSDWMALNKSKSFKALGAHSLMYSVPFFACGGLAFGGIQLVSHFIIDGITSRITAKLWTLNRRSAFFNMIGFDQFLHVTILLVSYQLTR